MKNKLRATFNQCRSNSRRRGVGFELTFEQWLGVWIDSGHFQERGKGGNKYVMARLRDKGPYKIGNVKIITGAENRAEQIIRRNNAGERNPFFGKTHAKKSRVKIGKSKIGNKYARGRRSPEQCARIREARWGAR